MLVIHEPPEHAAPSRFLDASFSNICPFRVFALRCNEREYSDRRLDLAYCALTDQYVDRYVTPGAALFELKPMMKRILKLATARIEGTLDHSSAVAAIPECQLLLELAGALYRVDSVFPKPAYVAEAVSYLFGREDRASVLGANPAVWESVNWSLHNLHIRDEEFSSRLFNWFTGFLGDPDTTLGLDRKCFTADVVALARGIYEDKAFDRLPILKDALMDADCIDNRFLTYCESTGPHHVGAWQLDLLTGRR